MEYRISYDIDVYTLISAADLVITDYSNIGAEAILLDKPLLTVNFIKEKFDFEQQYYRFGAALYFEDYGKVEDTIIELLNYGKYSEELKAGRQRMAEMYNYHNDGKAAERIVDLLLNESSLR